jgi:hypothetical protein
MEYACQQLRHLRVELPAERKLQRVVDAALNGFFQDIHRRIAKAMPADVRTRIDALLVGPGSGNVSTMLFPFSYQHAEFVAIDNSPDHDIMQQHRWVFFPTKLHISSTSTPSPLWISMMISRGAIWRMAGLLRCWSGGFFFNSSRTVVGRMCSARARSQLPCPFTADAGICCVPSGKRPW